MPGIDTGDNAGRNLPLLGLPHVRTPPALVCTREFDRLRGEAPAYAARPVRNAESVRYREGRALTHGTFAQLRSILSATVATRTCR